MVNQRDLVRNMKIMLNFDRWNICNFAGRNRDKDNVLGSSGDNKGGLVHWVRTLVLESKCLKFYSNSATYKLRDCASLLYDRAHSGTSTWWTEFQDGLKVSAVQYACVFP